MRTKNLFLLACALTCMTIAGCQSTVLSAPSTNPFAFDVVSIEVDGSLVMDVPRVIMDTGVTAPADSGVMTPPDDSGPLATSWTSVYTNVIAQRCTPCHTTPGGIGISSGGLDMTSQPTAYANLVNVPTAGSACAGRGVRVTPSQAAMSVLFLKVSLTDPAPCGSKMPLDQPPLSQEQVAMIQSWINAGALNN